MKRLILLFVLILISGCYERPIGGERDEYGCLGAAGYRFDKDVNACIRDWELNDNQREAAKISVEYLGWKKGMTVIEVNVARCPGCFSVELEVYMNRIKVNLENWEVVSKSLTPDECIEMGGRTVNIVGGSGCDDDEINIGEVTGFISPNICCRKV